MVGARQILCEAIDLALAGTIDYDDQIYMSCLFAGLYQKFHTVICDESQDISHLNRLQLMKSCASRLIIAGDQKQGIYAFRGADSSSMKRIKELRAPQDWIDLPLTVTWRCPKVVVARQLSHAPQYTAALEAPEGTLVDLRGEKQWTISRDGVMPDAILCRNNAPLISLAFALLRKRIGVKMLGRDFGKSLTSIVKKVNGSDSTSIMEFMVAFRVWYEKQCRLAHAADKEEKVDRLTDQYESIMAVAESLDSSARVPELVTNINALFEQTTGQITLSTGHKAKGLEWHCVLHLDPWRIPSKWARLAASDGDDTPLEQEMNLQYVIETRAKDTLILANLEQFT
jgi:superfamily I DNA/RNA helicase